MPAQLALKCPSCRKAVEDPAPRCPHCQFSLEKLARRFVPLRNDGLLSDSTRSLTHAERRKLRRVVGLFRSKFPQTTLSLFLAELPAGNTITEYAFWLANRERGSAMNATVKHNFELVLLIDITGSAALTAGYGLEKYLADEDLNAALRAGRAAFATRDWATGIERCLQVLTERMRRAVRLNRRAQELKSELRASVP
ncbi:MAG: hypothetical protein H0X40_02300 [Chthoniobacterales bacterium]|nr:hypothetical protein [Chthoniobacterales bacterium]